MEDYIVSYVASCLTMVLVGMLLIERPPSRLELSNLLLQTPLHPSKRVDRPPNFFPSHPHSFSALWAGSDPLVQSPEAVYVDGSGGKESEPAYGGVFKS